MTLNIVNAKTVRKRLLSRKCIPEKRIIIKIKKQNSIQPFCINPMYAFRITIVQGTRWKVWGIWIFKTFCPSTIYVWSISTCSVIVISGSQEWKGLLYKKWNCVVNHKPTIKQWNNNNENTPPKPAKVRVRFAMERAECARPSWRVPQRTPVRS